jgi:hypothetical protein
MLNTWDVISDKTVLNAAFLSKTNTSSQVVVGPVTFAYNAANATSALTVNQVHASSTGKVIDLQFGGVTKAYVDKNGTVLAGGIANLSGSTYGYINFINAGMTISRNIADANPALIINQAHASSTGKILDLQFGGSSKASFDKDGNLSAVTVNEGATRVYSPNNKPTASALGVSIKITGTATLTAASWAGSSAPYTYTITATGVLATDNPHIACVLSHTNYAADQITQQVWAQATSAGAAATADNTITLYAKTKPTVTISMVWEVNR